MSVWALIPAKDPALGKSRLSARLTPEQRLMLSRFTFERALAAAARAGEIDRTLVVTNSLEFSALATRYGATVVAEEPPAISGGWGNGADTALNAALTLGASHAVAQGATALLVLAADLPLVTAGDLGEVVRSLQGGLGVALCADRHGGGTNVLFCRPPLTIPFAFGQGSFETHRNAAATRGLPCLTPHIPELALDVDTPDDLDALATRVQGPRGDEAEQVASMLAKVLDINQCVCAPGPSR